MKKHKFYSMVRENGAAVARQHDGYTDGTYNYYKKDSAWFAIHPLNGLSICQTSTRKEAAEAAHAPEMAERIAAAVERQPEAAKRFTVAMAAAKEAAA